MLDFNRLDSKSTDVSGRAKAASLALGVTATTRLETADFGG